MKHKQPRRMLKQISFTAEGLSKIKKEYKTLQDSRAEAVATLKAARELGDLSENGLYKAARARLSSLDNQLFRLETMIKLAKIEEIEQGVVGIGSHVTVSNGTQKFLYTIVGGYESDPVNHKISHHSPIGNALIGKKVGEQVEVAVPAGKIIYTVIEIL